MSHRTAHKASKHVARHDGVGITVAFVTAIIFGLYPAASRAAFADGASASFVLLVATVIRTLMLVVFCRATNKRLFVNKSDTKAALTGGFWQGVSVIAIMFALAYIQGPLVLTILFTATLMLLFFMAWRGEIKLDTATILSTIFVLSGMTVVLDVWNVKESSSWIGYGFATLAAIATTSRIYVYGHQMKTRNPAIVGAESFLVATVVVMLVSLWSAPVPPSSVDGWLWTLLSSLSLGIGNFGMFYGIALLGAFKWSLFAKSEPIFASLFSVLFLGEVLKTSQYLGILAVIAGLVAYQVVAQKKTR